MYDSGPMSVPIVFVDLETTGATPTADRITEIGIVEVSEDGVSEWSSLVNPETRISEFIERLTGISNAMVADAPPFDRIAEEVLGRLQGRLFVAHNARFDYGFLKNEFARTGLDFRATVLCTVKLSRRLYPQHRRHNLDALVERHGLRLADRHRALGDARLIWQFWQCLQREHAADELDAAIAQLTARPSLPPQLDAGLVDDLPEKHGIYLFYGETDLPLYIGKANNIKDRVLAHFRADHAAAKEMELSLQVKRIDWIETGGELGALLKEATLVKQLQPSYNRRLRRNDELCTWRLEPGGDELQPTLAMLADVDVGRDDGLFGLFKSRREAERVLREIADEHGLCHALLGIEKVRAGKPCWSHQLKKCRGACVGNERRPIHDARLLAALARIRLAVWPQPGAVGVREGESLHVLDAWRYLGSARDDEELRRLLELPLPPFDADVYKVLRKSAALLQAQRLHRETLST
jgi:DNA polymerase-3 subunit epsilon